MAEAKRPRAGRSQADHPRARFSYGGSSLPGPDAESAEYWLDDLRSNSAAQTRRREQWLRRQSAEDATVAGVLVDHAEQNSMLAITTYSGNRHVGQVTGAGSELVMLDTTGGRVAIEVGAIETFRALSSEGRQFVAPVGHRSRTSGITMGEVLSHAAEGRPDVTLVGRSGTQVVGALVAVGRDVVMVRPPTDLGLVYLPLASVSEALLPASTGSG